MSKHRNPRKRLPKRSVPDNVNPGPILARLYTQTFNRAHAQWGR